MTNKYKQNDNRAANKPDCGPICTDAYGFMYRTSFPIPVE